MTFHLYGFIIGLAIVVALLLIEKKAKEYKVDEKYFWKVVFLVLIGGIIGARIWHLITDFHLYKDNLEDIFKVWNGGLSIIGAVLGGVLSVSCLVLYYHFVLRKVNLKLTRAKQLNFQLKIKNLKLLTDLVVFGLPFGQALGRWANYFNQELYGLPSNLPWAIYIKPENRLTAFAEYEYYHPLFAYEGLLMLCFGIFVWWAWGNEKEKRIGKKRGGRNLGSKKFKISSASFVPAEFWRTKFRVRNKNLKLKIVNNYQIGSGKLFYLYILYYAVVRFCLDFLRIEKIILMNSLLGVNQVFLLGVILIVSVVLMKKKVNK